MNPIFSLLVVLLFTVFTPSLGLEIKDLKKETSPSLMTLTIDYKTFYYNLDDKELITLFGGRNRKYLGRYWYWGESGYAAIQGKRHGYIEGGVILGYRRPLFNRFIWDGGIIIGAAGGGASGLPEGDGLNIQTIMELGYQLTKSYSLSYLYGYTKFINGDIESVLWGMNIGYNFNVLKGL
ncbi:hypothetical protein DID77_03240 [Candidatus Marinamargulisbacteria bacterium SCGC AG-439-L15]|nr:hypothetical protein DID77_03240 [Candidatus Marinamargulisbacteria bacterium SCGC AG-439-L15]